MKEYTITPGILGKLRKMGRDRCSVCGRLFKKGQKVKAQHNYEGKVGPNWPRHVQCYERFLL